MSNVTIRLSTEEAIDLIKAVEAYPHEWQDKDRAASLLKRLYSSQIDKPRRKRLSRVDPDNVIEMDERAEHIFKRGQAVINARAFLRD